MNWGKTLFIGGSIAALAYLLLRFSGAITYNFRGVKWLGRNGVRLRFALLYSLENRNDIPATVTSMKGRLLYGNYEVNEIRVEKPVTIQPGKTENIEVLFEVRPGALLSEIEQFVERKSGFKRFRLKGVMTGKVGEVPFAYPINEVMALADES